MTSEGTSVGGEAGDGRVIPLDDDRADELFEVLSTERHRAILRYLQERRATADELAAALDVPAESVQVALDRLEAADLVETIETTDPTAGEATTVYAPADEAVVRYGEGPVPERRGWTRTLLVAGAVLAVVTVFLHLFGGASSGDPVPASVLFFAGGTLVLFGWAGYRAVVD